MATFGLEVYSDNGKIAYDSNVIHYTLHEEMDISLRPFDYSPEYKGFHSIIKIDTPVPADTTPLVAVKLPESQETEHWTYFFGVQEVVLIRQGNFYTHFRVRWLTNTGNLQMFFTFRIYVKSVDETGAGMSLYGKNSSVISADSYYPLIARSYSGRTKKLTSRTPFSSIRDGYAWLVEETYDVPSDSFYVANMQYITLGSSQIGGVTVRGTTSVIRLHGQFRAVFTMYPSSALGDIVSAGDLVYLSPTYFIRHAAA